MSQADPQLQQQGNQATKILADTIANLYKKKIEKDQFKTNHLGVETAIFAALKKYFNEKYCGYRSWDHG